MKERPILMSAPMVRALLDGSKTQTRRALRYQPTAPATAYRVSLNAAGTKPVIAATWIPEETGADSCCLCPYGVPGDRLWVRETHVLEHAAESGQPPPHDDGRPIKLAPADDFDGNEPAWIQPHYRATDPDPGLEYEEDEDPQPRVKWRPSIFMPRWASRITLEVTDVRVERLQEISEADAIAEGAPPLPDANEMRWQHYVPHARGFVRVWDTINGAGSWDTNPYVWVVSFRRIG